MTEGLEFRSVSLLGLIHKYHQNKLVSLNVVQFNQGKEMAIFNLLARENQSNLKSVLTGSYSHSLRKDFTILVIRLPN